MPLDSNVSVLASAILAERFVNMVVIPLTRIAWRYIASNIEMVKVAILILAVFCTAMAQPLNNTSTLNNSSLKDSTLHVNITVPHLVLNFTEFNVSRPEFAPCHRGVVVPVVHELEKNVNPTPVPMAPTKVAPGGTLSGAPPGMG